MIKRLLATLISVLFISATIEAGEIQNLRGQRYCEIILGNNFSGELQVYNTIGLNQCPANLWNKITPEKLKQQTKAAFVHLNGPRVWMIDGMLNSNLVNTTPKVFENLPMREAGILELSRKDMINASIPYQKHFVKRQTTWVYEATKPIYEITDQQGKTFVMQSFSLQKKPQTQESLASLQTSLHLPNGWSFRSRILDKPLLLTAENNLAIVIQDEYLNTYQQEN